MPPDIPAELSTVDWLDPWQPTQPGLESELEREIGPGHPLFGRRAIAVGRRSDNDDVLFWVPGSPTPYAVVHLTWTGKRERSPQWPATTAYASLDEWRQQCMLHDHEEYTG
jgi:hypothetical protein